MNRPATDLDRAHLRHAIELAHQCPPSRTAFSVGAVITDAAGAVLASGRSRETDPHDHAEEAALAKIAGDGRLQSATIYSSLEPCSTRASRPRSCTELILATPIPRIVFAWREPDLFVDCEGAELLRAAGREVIEVPELAHLVRRTNAHLLPGDPLLTLAPAGARNRKDQRMIFIVVKFAVRPDRSEDWLSLVEDFTAATRREPGNIFFEWSKSLDNPNQFVLVEAFESREAGEVHVNSDHFKAAMAWIPDVIAEKPEIVNVEVPGDGWAEMAELEPRRAQ